MLHINNTIKQRKQLSKIWTGILLLFCLPVFSQLGDFDLQLTKTDESCLGNGSITFSVTNTTPLATIVYMVYKYPNIVNPISVLETNTLGSLNEGTYKVIATQTLGDVFNSQEQDIIITKVIIPLAYDITATNQNCSQGGTITITTTSGTAQFYEIASGPVLRPQQTSNVFEDLPEGTYNIRVFNECGEGVVTTYTLLLNSSSLSISQAVYPAGQTNCNSIEAINTITPSAGTSIGYPITVHYIIHPPNGVPDIITTETFASGPADSLPVPHIFPQYAGQPYSYDIEVTDSCNSLYEASNLVMNPMPVVTSSLTPVPCGKFYFTLNISSAVAPYTINFLEAPANFNPVNFNASSPGPFTDGVIDYGSTANVVPEGTYEIEVTDACGRKAVTIVEIEEILLIPVVGARNNGCYSDKGKITISVPARNIVNAIITIAPSGYAGTLPQNVSGFIINGIFVMTDMPVGTYEFKIVDDCGDEYIVQVIVPPFQAEDFTVTVKEGCAPGSGGVEISSPNGSLTQITLTSAPSEFSESLPYNASQYIVSNGKFYIGGLPEGNYNFSGTDACGIQQSVPITIQGYQPAPNPFTFSPHCGSFDITLNDAASAFSATYWLQKQDPATGTWTHPATGAPYIEGSLPDSSNSISIENGVTTHNLIYTGTLRILKSFQSVVSGVGETNCFQEFDPFNFRIGLEIANAYRLECLGTPNDIYIEAYGIPPYTFEITEKDGEPFSLNNGTNNIFSDLEIGIYKFRVEDACGDVAQSIFNVSVLPSLVTANDPGDILMCADSGANTNQEFNLALQTPGVLGEQSPGRYTVTYHATATAAQNNTGPLSEIYNNLTNPQTVYARVAHNGIDICRAIVPFQLRVSQNPELDIPSEVFICNEGTLTLDAGNGYDYYSWSTGATTQTIVVDSPGDYSVTVRNYYDDEFCEAADTFLVSTSAEATNVSIDTEDWTDDLNSIIITATGTGDYEYSLDGTTYQSDNVFGGLVTGVYTVYIRDVNGCGFIEREVVLLNYPKFFTPNGDGVNDRWRIQYSTEEPDMVLFIYDRYGKLITSFDGMNEGWDGTYNGERLPSTDYWFVANREDGRVFKGHFAMKR